MSIRRPSRGVHRVLPLLTLVGLVACGGDGTGSEPDITAAFIGDWHLTSFVIDGNQMPMDGPTPVHIAIGLYADGSYQLIVSGDVTGLLCGGVPSCHEQGDYSYSGNVITLDPGTPDAIAFQYAMSGGVMTISGQMEGHSFSGTFERN
jgi:hypothetical protein